jgi:hypothetical protein
MSVDRKPVVVIIGAGFGGLPRAGRPCGSEVIVDRANHHLQLFSWPSGLSAQNRRRYGIFCETENARVLLRMFRD